MIFFGGIEKAPTDISVGARGVVSEESEVGCLHHLFEVAIPPLISLERHNRTDCPDHERKVCHSR